LARSARIQGAVVVQVKIGTTGTVTDAVVIGGHPLLTLATLEAAKGWTFDLERCTARIKPQSTGLLKFQFSLPN
jgi:TonB family protein